MQNLEKNDDSSKAKKLIFNKLIEQTKDKAINTIQEQKDQHVAMRKLVFMQKLNNETASNKKAEFALKKRLNRNRIYR